jgi:PAS domain S-box-containing protein
VTLTMASKLALPVSFLTVFDRASIALSLADAESRDFPLIRVNEAFAKLTGYGPADCTGRNCRFLQGPETSTDQRAALRHAVQTGSELAIGITNYKKNGTKFLNYVYIYPIIDREGYTVAFLGSQFDATYALGGFSDINHTLKLQAEINAANQHLREATELYISATRKASESLTAILQAQMV